jgi:hypothetical protein
VGFFWGILILALLSDPPQHSACPTPFLFRRSYPDLLGTPEWRRAPPALGSHKAGFIPARHMVPVQLGAARWRESRLDLA